MFTVVVTITKTYKQNIEVNVDAKTEKEAKNKVELNGALSYPMTQEYPVQLVSYIEEVK